MERYSELLREINTVCIDFHGVLTNGKINVAANGATHYECVHVKDISAMRELAARGYEVYVVTSSNSPIIDAFCKKVGCVKIESRIKDGVMKGRKYIAIGDSSFDYQFLLEAELAFCPADAEDLLLNDSKIKTLQTRGGEGCVYEILRLILQ